MTENGTDAANKVLELAQKVHDNMIIEAEKERDRILQDAQDRMSSVDQLIAEANHKAENIVKNAHTKAESIESAATREAEQVVNEANKEAERALSELEEKEGVLRQTIARLQAFEANYRETLHNDLKNAISVLGLEEEPIPESQAVDQIVENHEDVATEDTVDVSEENTEYPVETENVSEETVESPAESESVSEEPEDRDVDVDQTEAAVEDNGVLETVITPEDIEQKYADDVYVEESNSFTKDVEYPEVVEAGDSARADWVRLTSLPSFPQAGDSARADWVESEPETVTEQDFRAEDLHGDVRVYDEVEEGDLERSLEDAFSKINYNDDGSINLPPEKEDEPPILKRIREAARDHYRQ